MFKVLLIEDALEIQKLVNVALKSSSLVTCVSSIQEAEKEIKEKRFDLILLDIELPDGNGFKFCATIQNREPTMETPIVFLTARKEVGDKVMGFSLGAEDYIVKPFDPVELKARVESKLKKLQRRHSSKETHQAGDIRFEIATQRIVLLKHGREYPIEVTPLEFKLLYHLSRKQEEVFTRDQLILAVWGPGVHILDRTIDTHVSNLRKKLSDSEYTVKSVHGVGYRFGVGRARTRKKAA